MISYKTIFSFFRQFFWTTPFICFLLGYYLLNFFYKSHNIAMPHLVGKQIQQALIELSSHTLNSRILAEKEDPHVPVGTILSQIPLPTQKVKPHQTVLLTTAKHPQQQSALDFKGKQETDIETFLKNHKIRYKKFFIESLTPEKNCITHIPAPGKQLSKDGMILYFSHDTSHMVLFPSFEKQPVEDVKIFLKQYGLTPTIFHTSSHSDKHTCKECTVKEQKPLAGSFVNLKDPFSIQLKVGA